MSINVGASAGVQATNNLDNVNFHDLFLALSLERAELMETQMKDQAAEMKNRNLMLQEATTALAAARLARQTASADESATQEPSEYTALLTKYSSDYPELKRDNTGSDQLHNKDEWDVNIESIKGFIDNLNSESQMDMIKLQSLQNKFNHAFEAASNLMSKYGKGLDTLIGNVRG